MRQMVEIDATCWSRLATRVAEVIGLHFPPPRLAAMQRGVAAAATALGRPDLPHFVDHLLSLPVRADLFRQLASHLTIGETYFFRDQPTLDALRHTALPELIAARRGRDQRLRIWSAGCASGEEAYTLAILIREALPDLDHWQIDIVGTDLNTAALRHAEAACYGAWSFRAAPPGLQGRYFDRDSSGRYALKPAVRSMVRFRPLNLIQDAYPGCESGGAAPDIIFCRNVLMYLEPQRMRQVATRLQRTLAPHGWLVVSPHETSQALFDAMDTVDDAGTVLYRKPADARPAPAGLDPHGMQRHLARHRTRAPARPAETLHVMGRNRWAESTTW